MKRFSIVLTCVIIVLASVMVSAQTQSGQQNEQTQTPPTRRGTLQGQSRRGKNRGEKGKHRLAQMDTDKDQKISREEWNRRPKAFDRLDGDHDGFITREEIMAMRRHRRERRTQNPPGAKPPSN